MNRVFKKGPLEYAIGHNVILLKYILNLHISTSTTRRSVISQVTFS